MAEGFARTYGSDVLEAQSAGLAPALAVAPLTHHVMLEKNIDLGDCYPKELEHVEGDCGLDRQHVGLRLYRSEAARRWRFGRFAIRSANRKRCSAQVRDEIEQRVVELIERLRSRKPAGSEAMRRQRRLTLAGGLLDNKSVPPIMRMWRNWQTR